MPMSNSETKSAIISISKALLGVSFATVAAIGGVSGIGWVVAATAVPGAVLNAVDSLGPLLQKIRGKNEEFLEIPLPPWWSRRDDASWQDACTDLESRLPSILSGTVEELRKEAHILTSTIILRVFTNEIARQLSPWEVSANERGLMAAFVAQPLLQKVANVLKGQTDSIQMDVLATKIEDIANAVTRIEASMQAPSQSHPTPAASTLPAPDKSDAATILQQKWFAGTYDVYICYHQEDKVAVKGIDQKLKAEGILPWFDMRKAPGISEQSQQNEQIKKIVSCAVFIGKHALSDWQTMEVEALIREFVKRKFLRVIPVYLSDAPLNPELSVFLENFAGVDFRQSDPDPFAYLMWGITGQRPPII